MSDVNEELVRRYYELQGYFVRANVLYEYRRDGRGMGYSDIDLLVHNPVTAESAAVEIKGWHTERITASYLRDWPRLFYFVRPEATAEAARLLGRDDFKRVLVLSRLGRDADVVRAHASAQGVEIVEFPQVLQFLIDHVSRNQSAGSESEHVIRVLKIYGLVDASPLGGTV